MTMISERVVLGSNRGKSMKRKKVKRAIKALQAWLDGAEIEERHLDQSWRRFTDTMYFSIGHNYDYRIKPKGRREWWLNFRTGTFSAVVPEPYAGTGIKVREINE